MGITDSFCLPARTKQQGLPYGLFVCLFILTFPVISNDLQVRLKPAEA